MAMKRVVRDCLWGARRGEEESVGCGFIRDVGVGKREGACEDVDGVGWGDERAEEERMAVESWGDVG